ncbi:MAG: hypothetical protein KME47_09695 [Nodosilinea sp. WJT8-NPBG4]|jgi:hypothetical protein|nr:hypothetical protein [Nodosilinea sp. WJT8-NPBG4]
MPIFNPLGLSGGGSAIPVGATPAVVLAGQTGLNGVSLSAPINSTISFASIVSHVGSGIEQELFLSGSVVAVIAFPSDYLNPLRAFSYYHDITGQTYSGQFSNAPINLS